ncbi:hypothetical protein ACF0H5_000976 [Mactra antiquata]
MNVMSESIQFIKFVHDTNIDNKISANAENIIQSNKTKNMEDCAFLCYSNATCMAYFFTHRTSDCQLMNKDINYDTKLSSRDGTQYFYKSTNLRRISAFTAPTKTSTSHIMKSTTSSTTSRSPTTTSTTQSKTSTSPTTTSTISSTTSTARTTSSTIRTTGSAVPISCQDLNNSWVELHYPDGSMNHYRIFNDQARSQSQAITLCMKYEAKLPVFITTAKQDTFIEQVLKPCIKVYCLGCQITIKELDFVLKHKPTRGMGETVTRALRRVCDVHNFDKYELNANLTYKVCKHIINDEGMEAVLVTEYGRKHKMGVHKTYLDITNMICGTVLRACTNVDIMGNDEDDAVEFNEVLEKIQMKEGKNVKIAKSTREGDTKPTTPNPPTGDDNDDNDNNKMVDEDDVKTDADVDYPDTTTTTIIVDDTESIDIHEEL